jgi:hypothetical protein
MPHLLIRDYRRRPACFVLGRQFGSGRSASACGETNKVSKSGSGYRVRQAGGRHGGEGGVWLPAADGESCSLIPSWRWTGAKMENYISLSASSGSHASNELSRCVLVTFLGCSPVFAQDGACGVREELDVSVATVDSVLTSSPAEGRGRFRGREGVWRG